MAITVDSTGNAGYANSMAIVNGNPSIAYAASGPDGLRYVRATDANGNTLGHARHRRCQRRLW